MEKQNEIKIFEDKQVRTIWDAEQEKWYISRHDLTKSRRDGMIIENPTVNFKTPKG